MRLETYVQKIMLNPSMNPTLNQENNTLKT